MSIADVEAADPSAPPKATRREWIGLAVIALPCVLYSIDLTVLNLAVPALSTDLHPSATELLWSVDIYGFMVAGWLITMGTLGDRIGRRRMLMAGAAAFGAASLLAAFSTTADMLIAARALLGVAGATIAPSTLSLIRNMFRDSGQRTFAMGVWGTSYAAGGLIGPVLGGMMLQHFAWGSVFLLAVPVMGLLRVTVPHLLPEYRDPNAGRLDLVSAGLSLIAVLSAIYGMKRIAEEGPSALAAAVVLAGVALGIAFVRRQRHLADPLIDLNLFRLRAFSTALAMNMLGCLVLLGTFFLIAQYLQLVLGLRPLAAALWSLPLAAAVTAGSMLAPLVVSRSRPATVVAAGRALLALGLALLTQVGRGGLPILVTAMVILSIGLGPTFVLTTDLIVGSAPPERAGAAGAVSETGAELGGVLGIAILGSIGTAAYRNVMADTIPNGVPPEAAAAARGTLSGAVATAEALGDPSGTALLAASRTAFIQALELTSGLCAVIALASAVAAMVLLWDACRVRTH
jgi:MFS transporter, DHA2 family, multidrug resistance protein